jgi:heat shock protein HslJ
MRALTIAFAGVALALSGCGGGGGDTQGGGQGDLINTPFIVEAISVEGADREVYPPLIISFSPTGVGVASPCNSMSGDLAFAGSTLEIGPLASTKMACAPELMEQDQIVASTLEANPTYQISDGRLILVGAGNVIVAEATQT